MTPTSNTSSYLWTSEYVSEGHPDKMSDQISDAILDTYLSFDPDAKVACETMIKDLQVFVSGEVTSIHTISKFGIAQIVKHTLDQIGYDGDSYGVTVNISSQSPEINKAVDTSEGITAGDQGIMFGYATRQTPRLMPLAIYLAHEIIRVATNYRKIFGFYQPDMKSQITLKMENGKAVGVHTVVFSACHTKDAAMTDVREVFFLKILPQVLDSLEPHIKELFTNETNYYINPAGLWTVGGSISDCGLTGRKIVADAYGADCPIGGGAFSGKDPSKVDRSGAYMARWISRRVLNFHPEVDDIITQISYVIGIKTPSSIRIYSPSSGLEIDPVSFLPDIYERCEVGNIIEFLQLKKPIYLQTARYGHFGHPPVCVPNDLCYRWENPSL